MARRSTTRHTRSVKRPVEWLRNRVVPGTLVGGAGVTTGVAFDLTATVLLTVVSPTIVRIRGELTLGGDFAGPPALLPWAAGIVQMSRKAFSTGIAAVPFPSIDDADWQWYAFGAVGDGAPTTSPEDDTVHIDLDSKAMRRYEQDDQTMVLVITNQYLTAAADLHFACAFSLLIKE